MSENMNKHDMEARVNALKQVLNNSDYKAIKAGEGNPSSDWDEIKARRQAWRDEINQLESAMATMPDEKSGISSLNRQADYRTDFAVSAY